MRLAIEDFIDNDSVDDRKSSNKINNENKKLKAFTKNKFDDFYKLYKHIYIKGSDNSDLKPLSVDTLKTMLVNHTNPSCTDSEDQSRQLVDSSIAVAECEQVWRQIDLSCNFIQSYLTQTLSRTLQRSSKKQLKASENEDESLEDGDSCFSADDEILDSSDLGNDDEGIVSGSNEDFDDDDIDEGSEIEEEDIDGEELESLEENDDDHIDEDDDDLSEDANMEDSLEEIAKSKKKENDESGNKKSVFEDDFLKIDDLEKFLDEEDARDEKLTRRLENPGFFDDDDEYGSDNENEDDYLDYFSAAPKGSNKGAKATYKDFFDDINNVGEKGATRGKKLPKKGGKSVRFSTDGNETNEKDLLSSDDEDYVDDDEEGEDDDDGKERTRTKMKNSLFGDNSDQDEDDEKGLSLHERQLKKYRERIFQIEEQNLGEKPWQLTGETSGASRPEDSLLTEVVQFDSSVRLPPEITAEKTASLEQVLMRRIKDKTFDDVVRKVRPKEQPFEYKQRLLLEQNKSQLSLAEVYEQEFLKQVQQENDQKERQFDQKQTEIMSLMKSVFYKLDMLSHFSLTPQAPSTEMKVISNAPALSMEEAVPVALAQSAQLAPEEIRKVKASEEKSALERSKTDKLRQRRKKKIRQKAIAEVQLKKLDPNSKEKALIDLKKSSSKSLKIVSDKNSSFTNNMTSTSFFSQLTQKQQQSQKATKNDKKRKFVEGDSSGTSSSKSGSSKVAKFKL